MKKLLLLAAAFVLPALTALAQTYTVTPSASTYSAVGGQITFTVNLTYPTSAVSGGVSFYAKPPGEAWFHVGTGGNQVPQVSPNGRTATYNGDTTVPSDPSSMWGWSYQDIPVGGAASFTFTVEYPAGLNGTQTITFGGDYRANNVATPVTVASVELNSSPTFTAHPQNVSITAGQSASFTAAARGGPTPTLKWQRSTNGGSSWGDLSDTDPFSNTTTGTMTVTGVTPAMAGHQFRAVATSAGFTPINSNAATLTVQFGPSFVVQPRSQAVALGGTLRLSAVVVGNPAPTLQWKKGTANLADGGRIAGATTASLVISAAEAGDAGSYSLVATNAVAANVSSDAATITLAPAGYGASHALQSTGYVAGSTITINTSITFAGDISSLGYSVPLPAGWSYAASSGTTQSTPDAGTVGVLNWAWSSIGSLTSPVNFSFTVNVPSGVTGTYHLAGTAIIANAAADQFSLAAHPDPLVVGPVLYHAADTNGDFKISLSELLRVISYYNARFTNTDGTKVQTGTYRQQSISGSAPDGFGPDLTKSAAPAAGQGGLGAYHSADIDRNGAISLTELLRVISYYNTRFTNPDSTKVQTGAYRVRTAAPASPDGYEPDPARVP